MIKDESIACTQHLSLLKAVKHLRDSDCKLLWEESTLCQGCVLVLRRNCSSLSSAFPTASFCWEEREPLPTLVFQCEEQALFTSTSFKIKVKSSIYTDLVK